MQCTLLISNLPDAVASDAMPALATLLARGETTTRNAGIEDTNDALLCQLFGVAKQNDYPTAALCAQYEWQQQLKPRFDDVWYHATPVYMQPSLGGLVLVDAPNDLTLEESRALLQTLIAHGYSGTMGEGLNFNHAPHAPRWYIYPQPLPDIRTTPISAVIGRNIESFLPRGRDASVFLRELNEIQMLLHEHPVNVAREARGALPINSVWFWGGGYLPEVKHHFDLVASDDLIAQALAFATKATHMPLPIDAGIWLMSTQSKNALITLEPALDDAPLVEHWCATLLNALRNKRVTHLSIIARDDRRVIEAGITSAQAKRWWKRSKPLNTYQA